MKERFQPEAGNEVLKGFLLKLTPMGNVPCPYQCICIIIKVKWYNDEPLLNFWRGYALSVGAASRREAMPQALRDASRSKIPVGVR